MDFPPFPGFRPQAFDFFRQLAQNNNREWFKAHKHIYDDEVWWPFQCLIADLSQRATRERLPLTGDPQHALFRIYRDTRFSKNKDPYKDHAGGVLSRDGGRKDAIGGLYIHVQPGESLLASGFWMPPSELLRAWRLRMVERPDEFLDLMAALETKGLKLQSEEYLKRMPQGFEQYAESPVAPYLKYKAYWVERTFKDEELGDPSFTDSVLQFMHDTLPLLEYGWSLLRQKPGR